MAVLKIDGDASGALRGIQQVERALGTMQSSAAASQRAIGGLTSAITAMAGAVVGVGLFRLVDDLQNMENKLRIATKSQDDFNYAIQAVESIANKTGQSLAATGSLYASIAQNSTKLGYSQAQVATTTNAMASALKASGASAEGARSTLYQFSQILAKGKVNGDEFTTIMENLGGPVMDLIASKMGYSTAELIKFKEKGLIGAKDFTDALIRSMGELDKMAGKAVPTLSQNLQVVQNSFAILITRFDKATGLTQTLGAIMLFLAKNIDVVVVAAATMMALFAVGRFIAIAAEIRTLAASMGVLAAVLNVIGKSPIMLVLSGLIAAATYFAGKKLLGDAPEEAFDLAKGTAQANAELGKTQQQLEGVADKYKDIIKDLNLQLGISTTVADKYQIENQLLTYKKQLENEMTAEQETQLRGLLTRIELNKTLSQINKDLQDTGKGILATLKHDIGERRIAVELEAKRRQYGDEAFNSRKKELEVVIKQNMEAEAAVAFSDRAAQFAGEHAAASQQGAIQQEQIRQIEAMRMQYGKEIANSYEKSLNIMVKTSLVAREITKAELESTLNQGDLNRYMSEFKNLSSAGLDILNQQNRIMQSLEGNASLLDATERNRLMTAIATAEQAKKQLEYYRQIKSSIEGVNSPLGGAAAGASAAGQLGQLDPTTAAKTANDTLFNGLKFLRENDLISQEQYNTSMISAHVAANDAIMAATQKRYETEKMYQLTNQTNSQFGYETQKQIASEAAKFEMKSTMEKTQFGMEQAAQLFSTLGTQNKKAFEASKALNIATAIMNTYMGATKAMATYPWPFGMIAAAAAVAAGMAQVGAIRSQQYSGRALGGPVMGNQTYMVGESGPELFTPSTTGSITRNGDLQGSQPVNVNFTIVANDTQGFDQLLSSRKGVIQQIISDAMLERGQRSTM